MAPRTILSVRGAQKSYGPTRALNGAELEIHAGEIHALVGGNGCGKSTLLKILAGVVAADGGEIEMNGSVHDLRHFDSNLARQLRLAFVHQDATTFDAFTVAENLAIGAAFPTDRIGRIRWRVAERQARAVLDRFELDIDPREQVGNLSPGNKTMLEIARASQLEGGESGGVLALDEPTAALTYAEVQKLVHVMRRFAQDGQAILFVSHRLDEVLDLSDRVTVFRDGRHVTTVAREGLTKEQLGTLIVGRSVDAYYPDPISVAATRDTLVVEDLRGGAVRQASLRVAGGEIVGIAGLAGSGRSTLLRLLFGAQQREGGAVHLDGRPLAPASPADAMRSGVAFVPENRGRDAVLPGRSIAENVSIVDLQRYWRGGWIRRGAERAETDGVIERFLIRAPNGTTPVTALSGGNQQKVVMARWLRREPRLLLLDEPTQGVDVGARAELWKLIREAASGGSAVVVVSSDFEELTHLCGRLIVLRNGRTDVELAAGDYTAEQLDHLLQIAEVTA